MKNSPKNQTAAPSISAAAESYYANRPLSMEQRGRDVAPGSGRILKSAQKKAAAALTQAEFTTGEVSTEEVSTHAASAPLKQPHSEILKKKALAGLCKKINGHTTREVKTTYEIGPSGERSVRSEVVTRKQNQPDLAAIIFTLTNIDGGQWRAKPIATDEERADAADLSQVPEDALRALLEQFA